MNHPPIFSLRILLFSLTILASVAVCKADPSMISPFYFGPNAFPCPEIVDRTSSVLRLDAEANYFYGRRNDHTTDVTLRAVIPLFTSRVNLSLWIPVMEWYRHSDQFLQSCNIKPPYTEEMYRGHLTGDVTITTDIHILTERKIRPDIVIRAGLKTASGGGSDFARYYDSPGYFFDAAFGKTLITSPNGNFSLRAAIEAGFLCWQTSVSSQNDAVMFGARIGVTYKRFTLQQYFGGYSGWEHLSGNNKHLAHDTPLSVRTRLTFQAPKNFAVYCAYEHGVSDYPYNHVSLGLSYSIPILKRQ